MASTGSSQLSPYLPKRVSWSQVPTFMSYGSSTASYRTMPSRTSSSSSSIGPDALPRVQLVPHVRMPSYDGSLSPSEMEILNNTNFDECDVSSKDFDFDDIFTYDKPQKKLLPSVEVSSRSRDKEYSGFPFSHQSPGAEARPKSQRARSSIGEMYVKNRTVTRKK